MTQKTSGDLEEEEEEEELNEFALDHRRKRKGASWPVSCHVSAQLTGSRLPSCNHPQRW